MNRLSTDARAYAEAFEADPTATFFHSPAWLELAARFEGGRTRYWRHPDGPVLALLEHRRGWLRRYTGPFGTYAGWVGPGSGKRRPETPPFLRSLPAEYLVSPYGSGPYDLPGTCLETHAADLTGWSPDPADVPWNRNHRRSLRAFSEAGLIVRPGNAADLPALLRLYARQVEGWGDRARRVYPDALLKALIETFLPGPLRLWMAERDGHPVACRLCFHHREHAVEWLAAAAPEDRDQGVHVGLVHRAMSEAAREGCRRYDFNPNPGLPGVDRFKEGFRAQRIPVAWVRTGPAWRRALSWLRRKGSLRAEPQQRA